LAECYPNGDRRLENWLQLPESDRLCWLLQALPPIEGQRYRGRACTPRCAFPRKGLGLSEALQLRTARRAQAMEAAERALPGGSWENRETLIRQGVTAYGAGNVGERYAGGASRFASVQAQDLLRGLVRGVSSIG
jgi:hypothetical protein